MQIPQTINANSSKYSIPHKLNTKTKSNIFVNIRTYTLKITLNLLSLQKIEYLGLHLVSAAR